MKKVFASYVAFSQKVIQELKMNSSETLRCVAIAMTIWIEG